MTDKEAAKLASKIKRCLASVPDDVLVIVEMNRISVIDRRDYYAHATELSKCKVLAFEAGNMCNIIGYETEI